MKRYWAFAYEHYYPGGGMSDCIGQFETLAEAKAALEKSGFHDYNEIVRVDDDGTFTYVERLD